MTSAESAVASWRAYNEVVTDLARERGWPVLDLAARAEAAPDLDALFLADGIHFTPRGLDWISGELARAIEQILAAEGAPTRNP